MGTAQPRGSRALHRALEKLYRSSLVYPPMQDVHDDPSLALRPTTAFVDLDALRRNLESLKTRVGSARILAIVKANAYGHGLVPVSRALLRFGADALGVAFLEEGIALRRAGIRAPVVVLGGIIGNQISHFLEYDLDITASSVFKLEQIEEVARSMDKRARIHLKVDTGMERIGMHWDTASPLFSAAVRSPHVEIAGVFSHLAHSDARSAEYTRLQLERFLEATSYFERESLPMPPRHLANSGAILQHPDTYFDMVRPGIALYGIYPSVEVARSVPLDPVLSLHTRVVYFKVVRAGSPVSYDGTWIPEEDTRVVTLPVGYGDGYSRGLSNRASVLIHGQHHPVVGRVTMDATMVDIGESSAYNGDEVVLLGRQGEASISCEELAELQGTIPYEVLTSLNTRVPRVYLEGGRPSRPAESTRAS
jgi:alanine racemase